MFEAAAKARKSKIKDGVGVFLESFFINFIRAENFATCFIFMFHHFFRNQYKFSSHDCEQNRGERKA